MRSLLTLFFFSGIVYCQPIIDFGKADSIANLYPSEDIQNLPVLVYNLTSELHSETQKFRAIYTWVCTHVKNDYVSYIKTVTKRKRLAKNEAKLREWNKNYLPKVYKRLINQQKTSCTGYAYLVKQMATLADLECEIVNGFARTANTELTTESLPNHSWNAIRLDNKWYLCDATWSAGKILLDNDIPSFKFEYRDAYFLASPELYSKNHYPIDTKWLLISKPYDFQDFLDGPLVYKAAFEHKLIPKEPAQMFLETNTNIPLNFELTSIETTDNPSLELILVKGDAQMSSTPTLVKNADGFSFTHTFTKTGVHDVHISINDMIIATYVVNVSKSSSYP